MVLYVDEGHDERPLFVTPKTLKPEVTEQEPCCTALWPTFTLLQTKHTHWIRCH